MRILFLIFFIFLRIMIYLSNIIHNAGAENGLTTVIKVINTD